MGYDIALDKQFIKTKDNRFIPMILIADSNLYEGYGKSERMVRSWTSLTGKEILTEEELLAYWKERMDSHLEYYHKEDIEVGKQNILWGMGFRIQGKSTYNDALNWIKTGCRKAITFEQLASTRYSIGLKGQQDTDKDLKPEYPDFNEVFNDEDKFLKKLEESKGNYKYLYIDAGWDEHFGKHMRNKFFPRQRRVKQRKTVDQFWSIKVSIQDTGYKNMYLRKHTARATKMDYVPYLKYETETAAQKVVDRYNEKYGPRNSYKVVKVDRPAVILA
jgi:hypothetical protein